MRTEIHITGQMQGNRILFNAMRSYQEVIGRNDLKKVLIYDTKAEAKRDLWRAYKSLRNEHDGVRYSKFGAIYYDLSKAVII
jgi:hypothetical protein